MAFNRFRNSIIIRVLVLSATLFVFFLLAQYPEFLMLDLKTMAFAHARAGHNPVIFYQKSTDSIRLLNPAGIALGLENGAVFKQDIEQANVRLQEDDLIILYTDGINEAMDEANHEFGDQKLIDLIKVNSQLSAGELVNLTKKQILKHIGKADRHDDMTMVVLKAPPSKKQERTS